MVDISGGYGRLKTWVKAQIATHKAVSDAHHSKYTDAGAVAAVLAADNYVRNTGDTVTGNIELDRHTSSSDPIKMSLWSHPDKYSGLFMYDGAGKDDLAAFLAVGSNYFQAARRGNFEIFARLNNQGSISFITRVGGSETAKLELKNAGNLFLYVVASGSTQANAGAAADEVWKTNGHASLPDNVLMIGI